MVAMISIIVLVVLLRNFLPEYSFCINILNLSYSLSYCIFIVRLDFEEILNGWKLFGFISTFLLFLRSWSNYFYLLFVTFIRDVYTFLIFSENCPTCIFWAFVVLNMLKKSCLVRTYKMRNFRICPVL